MYWHTCWLVAEKAHLQPERTNTSQNMVYSREADRLKCTLGVLLFICISRYRHYLKCPVSWCVCLCSCQRGNQRSTVGFRVEKWWQIKSQASRCLLIDTILKAMNSSPSPKMHFMLSLSHRSVPFLNLAPWPPASLMWCVASDFRFIHLGHFYQPV